MTKEQSFNETAEPTAIIPEAAMKWGRPQRQGQKENADREAWLNDLEGRKARSANQLAKRIEKPEVDLVTEIDGALNTLEVSAQDFESSYGKPNQPLIDARIDAERLRRELAEAEARLTELETKGDSVQRLSTAVAFAEAQLQGLQATAETEAVKALAHSHYGGTYRLTRYREICAKSLRCMCRWCA
jgi:chromosome segregation ATPase